MHLFARAVAGFSRERDLFSPPTSGAARVLVALSGGPDSVALLLALHEAEQAGALPGNSRLAGAAHFHHGLRAADADADAAFAAATCASLGLPCLIGLGAVNAEREATRGRSRTSPHNVARRSRYAFLRDAAFEMNATHVATAHTSDDQAETVLLRVLRGTTVDGLAAIPARRILPNSGDGENVTLLVRPLLEQSRAAVEAFLANKGVNARRDPSNDDPRYARSRVRRLLPCLARIAQNARLPDALNRLARAAALDADLLNRLADDLWRVTTTRTPQQVWLDVSVLRAAPPALRRRVLIRALRHAAAISGQTGDADVNVDSATMEAVEVVEAFVISARAEAAAGARAMDLPGGVRVGWAGRNGQACLVVVEGQPERRAAPPAAYDYVLPVPGSVWVAPARLRVRATCLSGDATGTETLVAAGRRALAVTLALSETEKYRDTMIVGEPQSAAQRLFLQVRPARAGERFAPLGMAGRTRLVRDVLADAGWPRALRETVPVVARGDTGEILWIVGLAQSESSRVTAAAAFSSSPSCSLRLLRLTAEPGC